MFWNRKKKDPPTYSVVGTVFVYAGGYVTNGRVSHHHFERLPAGTRVEVVDKEVLRDRTVRLHVRDVEGRQGTCAETEVWEHIGQC